MSYIKEYDIEGAHLKTLDSEKVVAGNIIVLVACYFTLCFIVKQVLCDTQIFQVISCQIYVINWMI